MKEASSKPLPLSLHDADAHVWSIAAAPLLSSADALRRCLSAAELARADRTRDDAARARFITTRAALRHILARYVGGTADLLELLTQPHGKPVVDAAHRLHFSLSHSHDLAVLAVARTSVGVDVEQLRRPRHLERTARRILHPDTCLRLLALPQHERVRAFLHAWTQREAHVKAVGGGLFRTPDTLPFADDAGTDVRVVHDRVDGRMWSIARFDPAAQATAALAAPGRLRALHFFTWQPDLTEHAHD